MQVRKPKMAMINDVDSQQRYTGIMRSLECGLWGLNDQIGILSSQRGLQGDSTIFGENGEIPFW